jgi:hypothetical protein
MDFYSKALVKLEVCKNLLTSIAMDFRHVPESDYTKGIENHRRLMRQIDRMVADIKDEPLTREVRCSFCKENTSGNSQLVAGPDVFICKECVEICFDLIDKKLSDGN